MKNKKLTKKDKTLLGVLIALIIIVIGVGAFLIVNNVNSANKETEKILSSASGEKNSSSDSADKKSDKKSSSKADNNSKSSDNTKSENTDSTENTDNTAVTDAPEGGNSSNNSQNNSSGSSQNNSSNNSLSKSSSADKPSNTSSNTSSKTTSKSTASKSSSTVKVKGDKVKRVVPEENTKHKSTSTLKVNGKTCYVGDTITAVLNLSSNKSVVNYQGTAKFDNQYLKLKTVKSNNIGLASNKDSEIMYNASTIGGMDFSQTGTIFTATFEVLKSGSTSINNDLEIISELVDNNIVQLAPSDYKATVDIYD